MDGLYSVTLMDLEDYSMCKTWVFDNKKSSYIFLCNLYEKIWKKHYIPNEDGTYNVIEKKSAHPNIEDYKSINFSEGEYYNIYFKDGTEIMFGICKVNSERIQTEKPNTPKEYMSYVGEDMVEAFEIAEQMINNPDEITFGDMIWLCKCVGMGKDIMNAKEDKWLDVVEDALRKLGYRI